MLRLTGHLRHLSLAPEALAPAFATHETRRWARKPLWMGTAKSKVFRVPKRPVIPHEETEELKRLYNNYRTHIKSIRHYLKSKYCIDNMASLDPEQIRKEFADDFERCRAINDRWNAEQKVLREQRVAAALEKDIAFARTRIVDEVARRQRELEEAEEIVRAEKSKAGEFITPEKLDDAIEFAIANPVDYNYAIDLEGNRIVGKTTRPEQQQQKQAQQQ